MKILCFHNTTNNPLDIAIKAITRSSYVHASILIDNQSLIQQLQNIKDLNIVPGQFLTIEAFIPRVRTRNLTNQELDWIDVFDVPSHTPVQETISIKWLIDQVITETPYDIPDLLRFQPNLRNIMGETNDQAYLQHTFCSMLVFNAYRFGGTKLLNCHDYEVAPGYLPWSTLLTPAPPLKYVVQ